MMDLRSLRQEVQQLPNLKESITEFQQHWIKPLRNNTNRHLPFLQELPPQTKKELNQKLALFSGTLEAAQLGSTIQDKLHSYARELVELKLAFLRNDSTKAAMITNLLLKDEFLRISQTLADVQEFAQIISLLEKQYQEINQFLERHLSLEETLFFSEQPHKIFITALSKVARDHKRLARDLGKHFVEMAKNASNGGKR